MASSLFSKTLPEQLILSYLVGSVGGEVLRPSVQFLANDAWKLAAVRPPDAVILAVGVAQGQVDKAAAYEWALEQGFDAPQMDAMVNTANVGMTLGNAYQSWRRGDLRDDQFQTQLHRLGIESEWWPMLELLKTDRLELGALATAVHRGIMEDKGLLVTPVPTGPTTVPRIPQSTIDTLAEFAAQGIDPERARILVADTGLPLALGEMLQLYNRGKVTDTDVKVSIAESNVRNEYMDVALDLARRLLTPHEAAEAELRGVWTPQQAKDYAALSGIDPADYDTLFAILGRPLAEHQIVTGLARGGTYGGTYDDVPAGPYRDAIRRSAIRPEYASLAYANRYTYPSAFVLRSLAQAGDLGDAAAIQQILEEIGWKPEFAKQVAAAWMGGTAADPNVKKAHTKAWTEAQASYIAEESTAADLQPIFTLLGIDAAAQTEILAAWDAVRALTRKQLSPAQIRKAVSGGVINPATGVAWTHADALAALLARGYDQADAETFLAE